LVLAFQPLCRHSMGGFNGISCHLLQIALSV
jgi:hypothetical protein